VQSIDSPMIPALADAMPALGIENLQKMGTNFCARTRHLVPELEARGKGGTGHRERVARQPPCRA
jgi:hypothetical protein